MSLCRCFLVCLLSLWVGNLQAHDPGLSTTTLKLVPGRIEASMTFSPLDVEALMPIDSNGDGRISPAEFRASRSQLEAIAGGALQVHLDGRPMLPSSSSVEWVSIADQEGVEIKLHFPLENPPTRLSARCSVLEELPLGHRQYLSLVDEDGNILGEQLLDAGSNVFETALGDSAQAANDSPVTAGSANNTFPQFLALGVEHILTGYDHLLFLFGLLLVGSSFGSAAKIITSFTIAHSLTLVLATVELVQVPTQIVEPLIAASITYVGVENLFRRNLERRWLLTFVFGLIHGLGFATVLQELGVGSHGGILEPLLAFNLGVELGQLGIAAVALPLIWKLSERPSFVARYAPAGSWMVALMGAYWLVERTLVD